MAARPSSVALKYATLKNSDLSPPLGYPGGPCHLIDRIVTNVRDPKRESLLQKVEMAEELTNEEANAIYKPETERAVKDTPFKGVVLTPHAQYRMDLRGVTVPEILFAIRDFHRAFSKEKSRTSPQYRAWELSIQTSQKIRWTSSTGLTIVFLAALFRKEMVAQVMTVYWDGGGFPLVDRGDCPEFDKWVQQDGRSQFEKLFKTADLSPPLGFPGGPCHLINRIDEEIKNPRLRDLLVDEVEGGNTLSNSQASKVYELEEDRGPGGRFLTMLITAHAQYRMDQRGVTVPEIRLSLQGFLKTWNDLKSRKDPKARSWETDMSYGEPIEWVDPKTSLVVVFTVAKTSVNIVTVYWKGVPDPYPVDESTCEGRVATRHLALKQGPEPVNTLVSPKSRENLPTDMDREKETNLPNPGSASPGSGGRDIGKFENNGPDADSDIQPRTKGVPGEQYGVPYKEDYNMPTRRTMTADFAPARERGGENGGSQRRQPSQDRIKSQKYYRKNRTNIKKDNKRRYKRQCRKNWHCKDRREEYNERPDYYARRAPKQASLSIPFFIGTDGALGEVRRIDPTGLIVFVYSSADSSVEDALEVGAFFRAAALEPSDQERLLGLVDAQLGLDAVECFDAEGLESICELYGKNPDSPEFKKACELLTGESDLPCMSPEQLDLVCEVLVLEEGDDSEE